MLHQKVTYTSEVFWNTWKSCVQLSEVYQLSTKARHTPKVDAPWQHRKTTWVKDKTSTPYLHQSTQTNACNIQMDFHNI